MAALNLGPLHRNGSNYIFNNGRLLVGWLEHGNQKTEGWFALSFDRAGEATGRYLYTSANGSLQLPAMSRLHPAIQAHFVGGNGKAYFSMNMMQQFAFLEGPYYDVIRGRAKYCEREGGELKAMTNKEMFPRHNIGNSPQVQAQKEGQKRKRDAESSDDTAKDKKARLFADYYDDNNEDDDEELPPYVKIEWTDVGATDQTPTLSQPATPDVQQHRPVQSQSQDQISAAIANLGMAENVVSAGGNPANQKHDFQEAAPSNLTSLTDLAIHVTIKEDLLAHIKHWALHSDVVKQYFIPPAGKLHMALEIGEILTTSRSILGYMYGYCGLFRNMQVAQQRNLANAKANGTPLELLHAQESLIKKYHEKETELRVVGEEMQQRLEALQAGLGVS
ncbi:hypothetical protein Q7P35_004717 [Cladosporium inversicolor]